MPRQQYVKLISLQVLVMKKTTTKKSPAPKTWLPLQVQLELCGVQGTLATHFSSSRLLIFL